MGQQRSINASAPYRSGQNELYGDGTLEAEIQMCIESEDNVESARAKKRQRDEKEEAELAVVHNKIVSHAMHTPNSRKKMQRSGSISSVSSSSSSSSLSSSSASSDEFSSVIAIDDDGGEESHRPAKKVKSVTQLLQDYIEQQEKKEEKSQAFLTAILEEQRESNRLFAQYINMRSVDSFNK